MGLPITGSNLIVKLLLGLIKFNKWWNASCHVENDAPKDPYVYLFIVVTIWEVNEIIGWQKFWCTHLVIEDGNELQGTLEEAVRRHEDFIDKKRVFLG